MSESREVPATTAAATCVVCREIIKSGALKCIHCDSSQSWTRHLNFSSVVLSLLVALISVVAAPAPILKSTFEQDRTDIKLGLLQIEDEFNLYLMASNVGTLPGGLRTVSIQVVRPNGQRDEWPLAIKGALRVDPGASTTTRVYSDRDLPRVADGPGSGA